MGQSSADKGLLVPYAGKVRIPRAGLQPAAAADGAPAQHAGAEEQVHRGALRRPQPGRPHCPALPGTASGALKKPRLT